MDRDLIHEHFSRELDEKIASLEQLRQAKNEFLLQRYIKPHDIKSASFKSEVNRYDYRAFNRTLEIETTDGGFFYCEMIKITRDKFNISLKCHTTPMVWRFLIENMPDLIRYKPVKKDSEFEFKLAGHGEGQIVEFMLKFYGPDFSVYDFKEEEY